MGDYKHLKSALTSLASSFTNNQLPMWQRIQTLYLLLTILFQWVSLLIPIGNLKVDDNQGQSFCLLNDISTIESIIFSVIVTLLATWIIVSFKDRKKQMQLCRFLIWIIIVEVITAIIGLRLFVLGQLTMPEYNYAFLALPIAIMIFPILAKHAIRKDDELVRSSNRLR